jgi:hypothetical protein
MFCEDDISCRFAFFEVFVQLQRKGEGLDEHNNPTVTIKTF